MYTSRDARYGALGYIRGYILVFRDTGEDATLTRIRISATSSRDRRLRALMSVRFPREQQRVSRQGLFGQLCSRDDFVPACNIRESFIVFNISTLYT